MFYQHLRQAFDRDSLMYLPEELLRTTDYYSIVNKTDQGFVLLAILSEIAVMLRGACIVTPSEDHKERLAMCTILNARPGAGKGRALRTLQELIKKLEQELRDRSIKGNGKEHDSKGGDSHFPTLTMSNCSFQMLLDTLANQSGFISMHDEEIGTLLELVQRKDSRSLTLKMLEGGTIERVTRKAGHVRIDSAQAVVLTACQPSILAELVKRYALAESGFLSRSFIINPGYFWFKSDPSVTIADYHDLEARLRRILDKTSSEDGRRCEAEIQITLSPQALSLLEDYRTAPRDYQRLPTLSPEGKSAIYTWLSRSPGHALKIAATLLAYRDLLSTTEIDERTMLGALAIIRRIERSMLAFCCELFPAPGLKEAKALVPVLRGRYDYISKCELYDKTVMLLKNKPRLDQGLSFLLSLNVIEEANLLSGPQGGRPKKAYSVNQAALEQYFSEKQIIN